MQSCICHLRIATMFVAAAVCLALLHCSQVGRASDQQNAPTALACLELKQNGESLPATVNCVAEIAFHVETTSGDPFLDHELDVVFTEPTGKELRVPAFWSGGNTWKVRYAPRVPGRHAFRLQVARGNIRPKEPISGQLDAQPYGGSNPLLKHGSVQLSTNQRYFAHADGTPFFWLADSWWHGMTSRLSMNGFKKLVADRREKGFTAIQFAVAFPCDIAPFDPRGANEAGHAWQKAFKTINPAYWDLTDRRVLHLVDQGIMPSIVGSWGYYIGFMGTEKMKNHWRYVVARYGALPVAWTLCGESRLPWYPKFQVGDYGYQQTLQWTEVGRYVRQLDPFHRLMGIHPGPPHDATFEPLADYSLIDIYFGMGGHGNLEEHFNILRCLKSMDTFRQKNPHKISIVGEVAWEGMFGGGCGPPVQRMQFWGAVLRGAPGHCYGTDSLWQMNSRQRPFGRSPTGNTWGNFPWEEAYQWPGSTCVAVGKRILERFEWWRFEPHQEWVAPTEAKDGRCLVSAAAGIPGEVRMFYLAKRAGQRLLRLEPGRTYKVAFISPIDGQEYPIEHGLQAGADGSCSVPSYPISQDWVLVVWERDA